MSIGVAIITHNARQHLSNCLPPLLASPLKPRVLVVNSSSQDGTVDEARRLGAEVLVIRRSAFNHGATREQARKLLGTDIVVMMTPDAYAQDHTLLERLVEPIMQGRASATYARQLPRRGAGELESFARHYNYPAEGHVRGLQDQPKWGAYLCFMSNSCAAYSNRALDEVGGFVPTLMGEDMVAAAKLLRAGHQIAYCADAKVYHSHNYTLVDEFKRHFEIGYARQQHAALIAFGHAEQRGAGYVIALLRHLRQHRPTLIPYALLQCGAKYAGYRLGRLGPRLPVGLAAAISHQDYYWTSDVFRSRGGTV